MKFLEIIRDFELFLSGGFAVYALLSMFLVVIVGFTNVINWMVKYYLEQ